MSIIKFNLYKEFITKWEASVAALKIRDLKKTFLKKKTRTKIARRSTFSARVASFHPRMIATPQMASYNR